MLWAEARKMYVQTNVSEGANEMMSHVRNERNNIPSFIFTRYFFLFCIFYEALYFFSCTKDFFSKKMTKKTKDIVRNNSS